MNREAEEAVRDTRAAAERNRRMREKRSFLSYAWASVRGSTLYAHWTGFLTYLRRFRTVALVLRVTSFVFAILETGALVILSTVIFVILFPLALALLLGILLAVLIEGRRTNRMLARMTEGKRVCVLFLQRSEEAFLRWNACDLAKRGYVVLVLSPYFVWRKGLGNRRFFCTATEVCGRVFLVRRYYFFSLRKRVLDQRETVWVY